MKRRQSLCMKITILFILISSLMCISLTVATFYNANSIIDAAPMVPSTTYTQEQFRMDTLSVMLGIIIGGAIITYYLTRKALKPLKELTNSVANRTVDTLTHELEVIPNSEEIYQLTKAFDQMSHEISKAYDLQRNFSSNAAHELRTPLAVLQTKLDVFYMKEEHCINDYDELLAIVRDNTECLTQLVQGLLELTRNQEIDLTQSILLKDMMDEIIYDLEELLLEKKVEISIFGENFLIHGNDGLLQRVFYNLIHNAIKYNTKNGSINIELVQEKKSVQVTISDTGIGIPKESIPYLFDTFYRVDDSRNREIAGSGLGLAIVKEIVNRHGGTITVKRNYPQGSIFIIKLPTST